MYPETIARYIDSKEMTGLVNNNKIGLRSARATIL